MRLLFALSMIAALFAGPARAQDAGAWVLQSVTYNKPQISANPCYPGRSADLADGSAIFTQGYADCTGERRVKGGERSQTTITWRVASGTQRLQPDAPLDVHLQINRQSSAVPYHGGGAVYFYFRSQSAVGGLELKGFLDNPALAKTAERDVRVDRAPRGREGEKLTMWFNVGGESGIGDVFYSYEFRADKAAAQPVSPTARDPADPTCGQYGMTAARQAQENVARGCGFTGDRWNAAYLPHFAWCQSPGVSDADLKRESDARVAALAACRPGTATPSPPPPPPPPPPPRKDSRARFSSITGEVEIRHEGDPDDSAHWHFAKLNTVLYVGDHIRTSEGSSVIIGFADLSTFLQKEQTEIVITTPPDKDSKLKLVAGNIMRNIKQMMKDGTMEVEMSQAVTGTKGTVYALGAVKGGENTAAVFEGAIEVKSKATGRTMSLRAGQKLRIGAAGFSAVETFDTSTELRPWREKFAGAEMQDIERRVADARDKAAPSADVPQAGAGAAPSGDTPYGYWAVSKGADGVKVGVVFPDYSPTEYTGAVFFCTPGSGVRAVVDSPQQLAPGTSATVSISAGGGSARYRGTASDSATEDGSKIVFNTAHNDPIFEKLANAPAFDITVNGTKATLPVGNAQTAFKRFFEQCQQ